jgi:uncharacterized protein
LQIQFLLNLYFRGFVMYIDDKIWLAKGDESIYLLPKMANRHGLIAGATGTGKTTTLKGMAESFSDMGVPVFLADIKGDLASLSVPGSDNPVTLERLKKLGIDTHNYKAYPVRFWDIFGEEGHPVRTTVSDMGPLLLARLLGLNDTQTGVLSLIFRIADDKGLLLIDLKDLKSMIQYVGEHATDFTLEYGNITPQSAGTILRSILSLEDQGGELFFGEPALDIFDWITTNEEGHGYINILHSVKLYQMPALYSTFLLWMLSELFEVLPEIGDMDKPKIVFFFDEAHLFFKDAPKVLIEKIEQVVRLIRSKGIGVYFITQSPTDLPETVLGQLGNRVQHALRAYTPVDQKMVRVAAQTFRPNPKLDTEQVIVELATGEALISCLDNEGRPNLVERGFIVTPQSKFGTIENELRHKIIDTSPMKNKYENMVDRESAFEIIQQARKDQESAAQQTAILLENEQEILRKESENKKPSSGGSKKRKTELEKMAGVALNTIGREVGKSLIRGLLGSLKR